jgi:hypothetical protein
LETEIPNFRELYEALWSPEETWYSEVLPGWMSQARDVLTALEPFRKRNTAANPYPLDAGYEAYLSDFERRHLDDLTLEERKELLIHRCFVTCAKDSVPGAMDRAPWRDRLSLPITAVWYFQNGDPNTADDPPAVGRE